MTDFENTSTITLLTESSSVPISLIFEACSAATENDGSIPYGTTISRATVLADDPEGTGVTGYMISGTSVDGMTVSFVVSNYARSVAGRYNLRVILTLDTGAVLSYRFTRVIVAESG